jgi:hypothetical protein
MVPLIMRSTSCSVVSKPATSWFELKRQFQVKEREEEIAGEWPAAGRQKQFRREPCTYMHAGPPCWATMLGHHAGPPCWATVSLGVRGAPSPRSSIDLKRELRAVVLGASSDLVLQGRLPIARVRDCVCAPPWSAERCWKSRPTNSMICALQRIRTIRKELLATLRGGGSR